MFLSRLVVRTSWFVVRSLIAIGWVDSRKSSIAFCSKLWLFPQLLRSPPNCPVAPDGIRLISHYRSYSIFLWQSRIWCSPKFHCQMACSLFLRRNNDCFRLYASGQWRLKWGLIKCNMIRHLRKCWNVGFHRGSTQPTAIGFQLHATIR